tara:strand:- start:612 stop:1235 length:624 start_codon:yes stop_codon:yes gene_type:complete
MKYTKTFTEALRQVREDGHTDVASAIRQCKTTIEDAGQMLAKLQGMNPEDSLPSWWMNKIAIAANSMNKLRDYLLVPSVSEDFDDINRRRRQDRQGGSKHVSMKKDDPKKEEDKIRGLENQIQMLKIELENEKNKTVKPEPNPDTGEVPLRTGVAQAILDKQTPMPKVGKPTKTKVNVGGKTKINVNPKVDIGIYSGGKEQNTGNIH